MTDENRFVLIKEKRKIYRFQSRLTKTQKEIILKTLENQFTLMSTAPKIIYTIYRSQSLTPLSTCPRVYPLHPITSHLLAEPLTSSRSESLNVNRRISMRNKWQLFEKKVLMRTLLLRGKKKKERITEEEYMLQGLHRAQTTGRRTGSSVLKMTRVICIFALHGLYKWDCLRWWAYSFGIGWIRWSTGLSPKAWHLCSFASLAFWS